MNTGLSPLRARSPLENPTPSDATAELTPQSPRRRRELVGGNVDPNGSMVLQVLSFKALHRTIKPLMPMQVHPCGCG
jgi:hypothetical protein